MKFIELTQGKRAIVDEADFNFLDQWKWFVRNDNGRFYASRKASGPGERKNISMAQVIMDTPAGMDTDHVNGNTLDNRKSNLRIATRQQNIFNTSARKKSTSKYRGVSWYKRGKSWGARIGINGKLIWLGFFKNEIEAAKVWNIKAKELFGEFAKLNPV